jgi:hypothetical protein
VLLVLATSTAIAAVVSMGWRSGPIAVMIVLLVATTIFGIQRLGYVELRVLVDRAARFARLSRRRGRVLVSVAEASHRIRSATSWVELGASLRGLVDAGLLDAAEIDRGIRRSRARAPWTEEDLGAAERRATSRRTLAREDASPSAPTTSDPPRPREVGHRAPGAPEPSPPHLGVAADELRLPPRRPRPRRVGGSAAFADDPLRRDAPPAASVRPPRRRPSRSVVGRHARGLARRRARSARPGRVLGLRARACRRPVDAPCGSRPRQGRSIDVRADIEKGLARARAVDRDHEVVCGRRVLRAR